MAWAFIFLFLVLKVPLVAACWIIWWATRPVEDASDERPEDEGGGGGGEPHPRPRRPRPPRRGPHAGARPSSPRRVRTPRRTRPAPAHRH